jgi:hypothetical protein
MVTPRRAEAGVPTGLQPRSKPPPVGLADRHRPRPRGEDTAVQTWNIPAGGAVGKTIKVTSDGFGGGDMAEVKIVIRNTVHNA